MDTRPQVTSRCVAVLLIFEGTVRVHVHVYCSTVSYIYVPEGTKVLYTYCIETPPP